jgi:UDP-N-acetylglucosamine--N-acetylmuramyl-(pentapeptide) pyrophosphoryl-undecaprenol N-acetylglucosamine transferase
MTAAAVRSVVLAAGGTAGHLEPAFATAAAIRQEHPQARVTFLGTGKGLEGRLVPDRGYDLRLVPAVPLPRGTSSGWLTLGPRLLGASRDAGRVLRDVRAEVVVGFGGYASLPAYLAARRGRVGIVVHEANARPGVANRVGARLTRQVAVGTPGTGLPHARLVGIPLRPQIAALDAAATRPEALRHFGLRDDVPTLLVFGGSQGARRINQAVAGAAAALQQAGIQVLHAAGPDQQVSPPPSGDVPYVVVPYLERMDLAYAAADLALCRSGALTCAELSAVGLPSVLVPYPFSNGEQALNAAPLADRGSALVVTDDDLTSTWVAEHVVPLLGDPGALQRMRSHAGPVAGANPAMLLVEMVEQAVSERGRPA